MPASVDLFVKSYVGFAIYFYCCLLVSNRNSLNNLDEWPILFLFLFFSVSSCLFADVFQSEMWSEFFSSTPEHLQPTASLVKSTVLGSKADGTVRTYLGGFRRWKRWASSNHVCRFPANPFQVAIYLQCLLQDAKFPSPVLNAVYSIDWAQQMAGLSKISDHYRKVRPTDLSCQGLGGIHLSRADRPLRRFTSLQSPCYSSVEREGPKPRD